MHELDHYGTTALSAHELETVNGGDGYDWGLAAGRAIRRAAQAVADAASDAWNAVFG